MNESTFEQWVKDNPFTFLWLASLVGVIVFAPLAALMNGGCALPFLAISLIGSTFGGFFAFFAWVMD